MKNYLVVLAFILLPFALRAQQVAQVQIKTSAVCDMCKKTLEKAMAYEKGVQAAELDVDSKLLTVVYRPDKTSPEKLRRAVSQTGYQADEVPADPRAFKRLPDCCQKPEEHKD